MAGNGKKHGQQNKDTTQKVSSPYVKFSNEDAIDQIIAQMSFLKINPEESSFEKILIKDKDGNPAKNKNGDVLYFYNVLYKIKINDGLIHNIKFGQRSNAMLSTSKNANMFDIQLYLNKEKKDVIRQKLFGSKKEATILNAVSTYSEFKTEEVQATISFNVINKNGKKAFEEVENIIRKIHELLIKPEEQVLKADLVPTNFPTLSKDAKPFQMKAEVKVAEVKAEVKIPEEVKAEVKIPEEVKAEVKIPEVKATLGDILKKIENGKQNFSKLSKEELELENEISSSDDKIKKFELEMKQKLEIYLKEFIKNKEENIKRLEIVKSSKIAEMSIIELNSKIMIKEITSTSWADSE
jgi:hypothetical protein